MLVGVKYCGGCRAAYDRKVETENVIVSVNGIVTATVEISFTAAAVGESYGALLAVCGCRSRCVDLSQFDAGKVIYISEAGDSKEAASDLALLKNKTFKEGDQ